MATRSYSQGGDHESTSWTSSSQGREPAGPVLAGWASRALHRALSSSARSFDREFDITIVSTSCCAASGIMAKRARDHDHLPSLERACTCTCARTREFEEKATAEQVRELALRVRQLEHMAGRVTADLKELKDELLASVQDVTSTVTALQHAQSYSITAAPMSLSEQSHAPSLCIWGASAVQPSEARFAAFPRSPAAEMDQSPVSVHGLHIANSGSSASIAAFELEERLIDPLWGVVRELRGSELLQLRGHKDGIRSVSYDRSGSQLASGSNDKTIRVWNALNGRCERILRGHRIKSEVNSVAFHPTSQAILASAAGSTCTDSGLRGIGGTLRLWNTSTGQCMHKLEGHTAEVHCVVFEPISGAQLFSSSGSGDSSIRVWDVETGMLLHTLVLEDEAGTVDADARMYSRCQRRNFFVGIKSLAIDSTGTLLASGSWNDDPLIFTIRLWDLRSAKCIRALVGHTAAVRSVAFHPSASQTRVASGSEDGTVRVWDISAAGYGRCLYTLEGHTDVVNSVCFDRSGEQLASCSDDNTIRIWDASSNFKCMQTLRSSHADGIESIAYDPSGSGRLASGSVDSRVRVWDVAAPLIH